MGRRRRIARCTSAAKEMQSWGQRWRRCRGVAHHVEVHGEGSIEIGEQRGKEMGIVNEDEYAGFTPSQVEALFKLFKERKSQDKISGKSFHTSF